MVYLHNLNPVLAHIGKIQIRYYGLFYVIGLLITYFYLKHQIKKKRLSLTEDDLLDYIIYLAVGIILGGRLFYILVYNLKEYIANPLTIFAIWQGGMAFHGALLGIIIASLIFCKKKKIHFYTLADHVVIPASLALALGRVGNFINGELYGRPVSQSYPLAVNFGDGIARHPSQLYESVKNLIIFATLFPLKKHSLKPGTLFWLFITMYGMLRFIIEFFRLPDPQLGFILFGLSMGQLLTIIMFIIGSFMLFRIQNIKE
ncbi:prolipoprotein diacylglyceryl transferase [Candidatus Woesearchaeota archaeon]|nr:prolipoprotein diacylglyceryl transferase [Candidatus Woesearchaeota archaeon]